MVPCLWPCSFMWEMFSVVSFSLTFYVCFCILGESATFLALNDNSIMKKRSCHALLCSVVSLLPPGLALQRVSPLCVACARLLNVGLFFLQSSCLQRFSLPIVGSKVCRSLLEKWDLPPPLLEPKCHKIPGSGDVFVGRVWTGLLVKTCLDSLPLSLIHSVRSVWLGRVDPPKHTGQGLMQAS